MDIDDLLDNEEEDNDDNDDSSSSSSFARDEIVWELWHRGNRRPVAVRDEELLAAPDALATGRPVVAQLALVASVQRVNKQSGLVLGLRTLTDGMEAEAFSLDRPFRLVAAKTVRKFGNYRQDRLILHSQRAAANFLVLKSIFEDAESYAYLHRNQQPEGRGRLLTVGQFFALGSQARRSYIARVSAGHTLPQPPPRPPDPRVSLTAATATSSAVEQQQSSSTAIDVDVKKAAEEEEEKNMPVPPSRQGCQPQT
jgi:hypothetical protein